MKQRPNEIKINSIRIELIEKFQDKKFSVTKLSIILEENKKS